MTVQLVNPNQNFIGNGVTTIFSFTFAVGLASTVHVRMDGVEVFPTITLNTNQSQYAGGEAEFAIAPANGAQINILRFTPASQPVSYPTYGTFPAVAHEAGMDNLALVMQEMSAYVGVVIYAPASEAGAFEGQLPAKTDRAGKYLAFDLQGNTVVKTAEEIVGILYSDNIIHNATTVFAQLESNVASIDNNAIAIGANINAINDLTIDVQNNTADIDTLNLAVVATTFKTNQNEVDITNLTVEKADKTVTITSSDTGMLTVNSPTLASDVELLIKSNVPNGMVKLDPVGTVPLSVLPYDTFVFQGIFVANPVADNPSIRFPTATFANGEQFIISGIGLVSVIDPLTGSPADVTTGEGDFLTYLLNSKVQPDGWYHVTGATVTATASQIAFDPINTVYAGLNLQAVAEEQSLDHLWRDRDEITTANMAIGGELEVQLSTNLHAGLVLVTEASALAGVKDNFNANLISKPSVDTVQVGEPTSVTNLVSSSTATTTVGVDTGLLFDSVVNSPTASDVGAEAIGVAQTLVTAHEVSATAHTPANVGAEAIGVAQTIVDAHIVSPTAHTTSAIDGLDTALSTKFNKTGGTISGSIRVEGVAVATGDITGFEGT